jgi:hypothetical protein
LDLAGFAWNLGQGGSLIATPFSAAAFSSWSKRIVGWTVKSDLEGKKWHVSARG